MEDCSSINAKISLTGRSKQEVRSGKNKLIYPYNTLSLNIVTDLKDGRLVLNGNLEENANRTLQNVDLKSGNYKFLFNKVAIPNKSYIIIKNVTKDEIINNYVTSDTTFSIAEDSQIRISIVFVKGTYTNYKMDLMILESTEQDETFEQYGASPTSKYSSKIVNTTGNVSITVCNKNVLNTKVIENNDIISVQEDGSLILQNNTKDDVSTGKTLKELCKGLKVGDNAYLKVETDYQYNYIYLLGFNATWANNAKQTITQEILDSEVYVYGGKSTTTNLKLQITKNKLEDYVQHELQTITFPLAENQKLYEGDYLASDGTHHVREQIELTGEENWATNESQNTDNTIYLICSTYDNRMSLNSYTILCNIAKQGIVFGTDTPNVVINQRMPYALRFRFSKDFVASVEEWVAYLKAQKKAGTPVIVEYELEREEVEPYTEEQQEAYSAMQKVKTYKTVTNIFTDSVVNIKFNYYKDLATVISNLSKQLIQN